MAPKTPSPLASFSDLTRACFGRGAGPGMAAVIGWAAVSGATGRPWPTIGGALCTGVAPWFAVRWLFPVAWGRWNPGPWLLGVHMGLVVLASRWIGVVGQLENPLACSLRYVFMKLVPNRLMLKALESKLGYQV